MNLWFDGVALVFGVAGMFLGGLGVWLFMRRREALFTTEHERQYQSLQQSYQTAQADARHAAAAHTTELATLREAYAALETTLNEATIAWDEESQLLAVTQGKLDTAEHQVRQHFLAEQEAETILAQLRPEVARLRKENAALTESVTSLEDMNEAIQRNLAHVEAASQGTAEEYHKTHKELLQLRTEHTQLQEDYRALRTDRSEKAEQYYQLFADYQDEVSRREQVTQELAEIQRLLTTVLTTIQQTPPPAPTVTASDIVIEPVIESQEIPIPATDTVTPFPTTPASDARAAQERILAFLNHQQITVTDFVPPDTYSSERSYLSQALANHAEQLGPFHRQLKRSLNDRHEFSLRFTNYDTETIEHFRKFGQTAHAIGLLDVFAITEYALQARAANTADAQAFFSGMWMEQHIVACVIEVVRGLEAELGRALPFAYLTNVKVTLPSGEAREMDLLFHVNGCMFWVEVKSSDYQQFINKYTTISQHLPLDKQHRILVVAELADEDALYRSNHDITIYSLHEFTNRIRATVKIDLQRG